MMGAGPLIDALDAGAEVVLAGRCADPAIYACAALPPRRSGRPGLARGKEHRQGLPGNHHARGRAHR